MKAYSVLLACVFTGVFFASGPGCSSSNDAQSGISCTPGNYVFCRCADRAEGTKLCKPDGASFEACSTTAAAAGAGGGTCSGGEDLTDRNTGTDVNPPAQQAGPPGSPVDTCPGKPTAVTPGASIVIDGDTAGATSDLKGRAGACRAGDGSADHVYHLQPTGSGQLNITVKGEGELNPLIYLRSACANEESQVACAPPLGAAASVQLQTNVVAGSDSYLVVDAASGTTGKYKLTMKLTTGPFCGDGKVDSGEACDDANKVEGDGCSNSCRGVSGDPAAADCATSHAVHMWKGSTVSGTGSTAPYGNTFAKPGASCDPKVTSNAAPDHVYEVTAHAAGNLKVTLTPTDATYNVLLSARKTCADAATQGAGMCANASVAGAPATMTFAVQTNEKVYVAADGAADAKGAYTIKFELP